MSPDSSRLDSFENAARWDPGNSGDALRQDPSTKEGRGERWVTWKGSCPDKTSENIAAITMVIACSSLITCHCHRNI